MEQYHVSGMHCAACSARVEKAVSKVPGVTTCAVNLLTNSMGVEGTASASAIVSAVEEAGYGCSLKGASGQTAPDAASILNYGFDQFVTLSLGDSDFSIISGGDVVVPAGTGADSLTTEDSQNGDQIDRTYLFNGTSVGSAVLEVVQSDDTASVQEGQQHMQAAKDYSDNHTEIPYFVIAGVFLLLLILLIWRIVKIVKS